MHINDENSPWRVVEKVDLNTFEVERKYFFKRREAVRVSLKDKIAEQYCGYALIEKDLRNVLNWLEYLTVEAESWQADLGEALRGRQKAKGRFNHIKGIYIAAMTTYGKCFAQCAGRKIKLDRQWIDEKHKLSHEFAIKVRNNFTAHSGEAKLERAELVLIFDKKKSSKEPPRLVTEINQPDCIGKEDLKRLQELVLSLQAKIHTKQDELHDLIFRMCVERGRDYW